MKTNYQRYYSARRDYRLGRVFWSRNIKRNDNARRRTAERVALTRADDTPDFPKRFDDHWHWD